MIRPQTGTIPGLLLGLALASAAAAQPHGIETRVPNTSIVIEDLPPVSGSISLQSVPVAGVSIGTPVDIKHANDGSNRVFIVDQAGRIVVYDADDPTRTASLFLDIDARVTSGGERGLLGLAFHPDYASNGRFFVNYTNDTSGLVTRVSEFINPNPAGNMGTTVPTERILLQFNQPFSNHNGGFIDFDADGKLLIATGDGGSANDPQDTAQNVGSFLGKILRIDVDAAFAPGKQYAIPADNPFAVSTPGPTEVIVESRQPNGTTTTPGQGYQELSGEFQDSPLKSTVTGLSGQGSRFSTNSSVNAAVRFTPAGLTPGLWDVYVTTPSDPSVNAANSVYIIVNDGEPMSYTYSANSGSTGNQWRLLRRNVPMAGNGSDYVQLAEGSPQAGNFFVDAVRLVKRSPLPEIYTYGMRNPWRFSVDRVTGQVWIGDVGQDAREEVSLLVAGGNYGWRDAEGEICTPSIDSTCDLTGYVDPIYTYRHSGGSPTGCSITGGYVYRGSAFPELYGMYIFTDYCNGWLRGLRWDGVQLSFNNQLNAGTGLNILTFGEREDGELLIGAQNGQIYEIIRQGAAPPSDLPLKLSDLPALLDLVQGGEVPGIIPYQPRVQFWSDNAIKSRYMAIPGLEQIGYLDYQGYEFPDASVLVKHFNYPLDESNPSSLMPVETRLMVKDGADWRAFSYRWNDAGTDADLLTSADTREFLVQTALGPKTVKWDFPNESQCFQCHTTIANRVLGIQTPELNWEYEYPWSGVADNQLRTFAHLGVFQSPGLPAQPAALPKQTDILDATLNIRSRARSYLQANCAYCHQPGGPTPSSMDLRFTTLASEMNAIDSPPRSGTLGLVDPQIVKPGDYQNSVLYQRIHRRGQNQMPPLASNIIDEPGSELIRQWILDLANPADPDALTVR
ncbi:MAG: PQQ-dependent sugar dehydrogenase [Candidatus Sumerlaeia bacterium]|nr:PQQ-dependent sugar dehydrogenase [Candidatus Sumerlaeia bacterium]